MVAIRRGTSATLRRVIVTRRARTSLMHLRINLRGRIFSAGTKGRIYLVYYSDRVAPLRAATMVKFGGYFGDILQADICDFDGCRICLPIPEIRTRIASDLPSQAGAGRRSPVDLGACLPSRPDVAQADAVGRFLRQLDNAAPDARDIAAHNHEF